MPGIHGNLAAGVAVAILEALSLHASALMIRSCSHEQLHCKPAESNWQRQGKQQQTMKGTSQTALTETAAFDAFKTL